MVSTDAARAEANVGTSLESSVEASLVCGKQACIGGVSKAKQDDT